MRILALFILSQHTIYTPQKCTTSSNFQRMFSVSITVVSVKQVVLRDEAIHTDNIEAAVNLF